MGLHRGANGQTRGMDVAQLARGQALNRVAMGAALIVVPGLVGRAWAGPLAADDRAKVLARALGARDLSLGAGGLLALREGDSAWARRSLAAQAFADAVDFLAIVAAGRRLPLAARLAGGTLAATSAAVAAAYARRLPGDA
jgi:hypothetical protein